MYVRRCEKPCLVTPATFVDINNILAVPILKTVGVYFDVTPEQLVKDRTQIVPSPDTPPDTLYPFASTTFSATLFSSTVIIYLMFD